MYGAANVLDCSSVFFVPWFTIMVSASNPSHWVTPEGDTMFAFSTRYTACAMSALVVAEALGQGGGGGSRCLRQPRVQRLDCLPAPTLTRPHDAHAPLVPKPRAGHADGRR